jgi:hypothetical protein
LAIRCDGDHTALVSRSRLAAASVSPRTFDRAGCVGRRPRAEGITKAAMAFSVLAFSSPSVVSLSTIAANSTIEPFGRALTFGAGGGQAGGRAFADHGAFELGEGAVAVGCEQPPAAGGRDGPPRLLPNSGGQPHEAPRRRAWGHSTFCSKLVIYCSAGRKQLSQSYR